MKKTTRAYYEKYAPATSAVAPVAADKELVRANSALARAKKLGITTAKKIAVVMPDPDGWNHFYDTPVWTVVRDRVTLSLDGDILIDGQLAEMPADQNDLHVFYDLLAQAVKKMQEKEFNRRFSYKNLLKKPFVAYGRFTKKAWGKLERVSPYIFTLLLLLLAVRLVLLF